jgi:hypothetical protein
VTHRRTGRTAILNRRILTDHGSDPYRTSTVAYRIVGAGAPSRPRRSELVSISRTALYRAIQCGNRMEHTMTDLTHKFTTLCDEAVQSAQQTRTRVIARDAKRGLDESTLPKIEAAYRQAALATMNEMGCLAAVAVPPAWDVRAWLQAGARQNGRRPVAVLSRRGALGAC